MAILVFIFFIIALVASLRVVPKGQVMIRYRLGREAGTLNPGLHLVVPLIDRTVKQNSSVQTIDFELEGVNVLIEYEVTDPVILRRSLADLTGTLKKASELTLKKLFADDLKKATLIDLSRAEREFLVELCEMFKEWGVKIRRAKLSKV